MKSFWSLRFISIGFLSLVLTICTLISVLKAAGDEWKAPITISSITVTPSGIAVGEKVTVTGNARTDGDPTPHQEITEGKREWSWGSPSVSICSTQDGTYTPATSGDYEVTSSDSNSSTGTFVIKLKTAAHYKFTLTASLTITALSETNNQPTGNSWTGTATSTSGSVAAVGIQKLQVAMNAGSEPYIDISGTLYAIKDKSFKFKAFPMPADASWPSGKPEWSGTSGASGSGVITALTFSTQSATINDLKAVIAKCGTSTATANVIVCQVKGQVYPKVNFPSRSYTKYGLGEELWLHWDILPSNIDASSLGLKWLASTGNGIIESRTNIDADYFCSIRPDSPQLVLKRFFANSSETADVKSIEVVAPDGIRSLWKKTSIEGIRHDYGLAGAGVELYWFLMPYDVSFDHLKVKVLSTQLSCTGYWGKSYYLDLPGRIPNPFRSDCDINELYYPEAGPFAVALLSSYNVGGAVSGRFFMDLGNFSATPYLVGTAVWPIPLQYNAQSSKVPSSDWFDFGGHSLDQQYTITAGGGMSIRDGNVSPPATLLSDKSTSY